MSIARAAFDFHAPGSSWLHRMDPRVKMLLVLAGSFVTLIWVNPILLVAGILLSHLALLSAGYPFDRLRTIWRAIAPLMIIVIAIWPLFDQSGEVLVTLGPLKITDLALLRGAVTALRLAGVSFVVILWIGTTDPRTLVRGFVRLGLPFQWGMALTIGLRFIPTFAGIFATVSDAQQSRGLILEGNVFRRARQMIPILVASLVSALRSTEQLAMTLESRAFGARRQRTVLHDIRMAASDWTILVTILVITAALTYATFALGFGRDLTSL